MYHPSLTSAVAAEHRATLLRNAEHQRQVKALHSNHRHIKLVRPQWWTRLVASVTAPRIAHA